MLAAVNVNSSIASEKLTTTVRNAWPRLLPSVGLMPITVGGNVSGTRFSVSGTEVVVLPPVSVARTWISTVVSPSMIFGATAEKSNGNATSFRTTMSLTNNSALRIWTSSEIIAMIGIVDPSRT